MRVGLSRFLFEVSRSDSEVRVLDQWAGTGERRNENARNIHLEKSWDVLTPLLQRAGRRDAGGPKLFARIDLRLISPSPSAATPWPSDPKYNYASVTKYS